MKKLLLPFCLAISSVSGLQTKPWFGDVYAFYIDPSFSYSYFHEVQDAVSQPKEVSNNYVADVDMGFTPSEYVDVDLEMEFARTPRQNFSFRSSALQGRFLLLDDIAGDPVSVTLGANIRAVGGKSTKDISSPYASYLNFELTSALGKELTFEDTWTMRGYVFGAVGYANHGSPWARAEALFEGHVSNHQRLGIFSNGYFGFGTKREVTIHDFHGWGVYRHRSVDVGALYRYVFSLWGSLQVSYSYRVYAKSYPEKEQFFILQYSLPFSFF